MSQVLNSVVDAIGDTPLVRLDRLTQAAGVTGAILAKLEYLNPGFSKKDRAALGIIAEAERSGDLAPGQTVVELTSGNTGTGLAIICAVRGYPFVAVMSKGNSPERAQMIKALGGEVLLVDQLPDSLVGEVSGGDLELVEQAAAALTEERGAFRADQFRRDGNWLSHYHGTGPEIWNAAGGRLDAFLDFIGTGGTYAGVTKALKERGSHIQCFVVEPKGAAAAAGERITSPSHPIQGGGYAIAGLAFLKDVAVDGYLQVSGEDARDAARLLARTEGIFGGFSSGANVAAALQLLRGPQAGNTIAIVICDSGLKYLSTDLWNGLS